MSSLTSFDYLSYHLVCFATTKKRSGVSTQKKLCSVFCHYNNSTMITWWKNVVVSIATTRMIEDDSSSPTWMSLARIAMLCNMWPGDVELAFMKGRLEMKMAKYYVTDLVINDEKRKKRCVKRGTRKNSLNFQWNECVGSSSKKRKLMCEKIL